MIKIVTLNVCDAICRWPSGAGCASCAGLLQISQEEPANDFSKYLRLAAEEEIVITRHGRPAGVLIGFASEDDWVDYRIEHAAQAVMLLDRACRGGDAEGCSRLARLNGNVP